MNPGRRDRDEVLSCTTHFKALAPIPDSSRQEAERLDPQQLGLGRCGSETLVERD
jgi:hypothetical protein